MPHPPETVRLTEWVRIASLAAMGIVATIAALRAAADILIPFALALFLAVLTSPLVNRMQTRLSRALAVGIVIASVVAVGLGLTWFMTWMARLVTGRSEFYQERLGALLTRIDGFTGRFGVEVTGNLVDPSTVVGFVSTSVASFFSSLGQTLVFLFLLAFLLVELPEFDRKIQKAFPHFSAASLQVFEKVGDRLLRYFLALTWISAATGLLTFVWCTICGVDFAILWGASAFVLNYIPYVGSFIAVSMAVVVALLQFDGLFRPLLVLFGLLVVQNVLGSYLAPRAFGRSVSVSPLVVFFSMLLWGWIWGPAGMLLSVPLTAIVKLVCEAVPGLRPIGVLLGPVSELDLDDEARKRATTGIEAVDQLVDRATAG